MPNSSSVLTPDLSLFEAFMSISDPRSEKSRLHPLVNILVIAVCGVISGADNWVAIEGWGKAKQAWLSEFLDLSNGIPSHDTFGRVFSLLSPAAFETAFIRWTRGLIMDVEGKVVAVDGKTLRRSHDHTSGQPAIHMVNAWCTQEGVSLGQLKTQKKSNEITAIPELLPLLHLKGAIVTIDAMGCQKKITQAIQDAEADYIIAVKDNQPTLAEGIEVWFEEANMTSFEGTATRSATQINRGHGREEERNIWIAPVPEELVGKEEWAGLRSIAWVEAVRTTKGKTSYHHRFYITSLSADNPESALAAIRAHWGVENSLHWVLDIAFREDESRVRVGYAAENMARLRQIAINLLNQEKSLKVGTKTKRLRAGWDNRYLLRVLGIRS